MFPDIPEYDEKVAREGYDLREKDLRVNNMLH